MCVINWRPDDWDMEDYPPASPRPLPRLAWAAPVDILELGSSLEAYERHLPAITALRLCHRFGEGPLSQLPQEILDRIASEVHQREKAEIKPKWEQKLACFQGICTPGQHFGPEMIKGMCDNDELLYMLDKEKFSPDSESYSKEDKARIVLEYVDTYPDEFDDCIFELHEDIQRAWLALLCTCEETSTPPKAVPDFARLNQMLKTHFGVETLVLHEVLSDNLQTFLPFESSYSDCSYYTSSFLALAKEFQTPTQGRGSAEQTGVFLKSDNHLAFHQIIDPTLLILTEKQRLRFARALRILGLKPHYHLSELEANINPSTQDDAFWAICHQQLERCPAPLQTTEGTKKHALQEYIHSRNKELAKRSWPQLMNIATSDAVVPSHR